MTDRRGRLRSAAWTVLSLLLLSGASSAQSVLQRGYDAGLSGANLTETTLNTSNVTSGQFGEVFTLSVDDKIFAQPLYVPNVAIPGQGTHNVLYVATMGDSLYAFDADNGGSPLWSINFANAIGETAVPYGQFTFYGNMNITGNLGILSTPVIDPSSGTLYLVACTFENGSMAYRLHAVSITSGTELNAPGTLIGGSNNGLNFNGRYLLQRASLTLTDHQVVFGFSAVEEEYGGENAGWVMAYDASSLQQTGIFATQNSKNGAGVWQSGRAPAVDSDGYVYVATGNAYGGGGYDGNHNFSESLLKLDPNNGLALVDWFTPSDWSSLDQNDQDLSSSGPLLIPGTNLLAGGGKDGEMYVVDTGDMGHSASGDHQIVQKFSIAADQIHGGPIYWQRSSGAGGPLFYDWGAADVLKAYAFNGSNLSSSPVSSGGDQVGWPGGILTLSANGEQAGTGVLWATVALSGDVENYPPSPGALYAYDAGDVSNKLWDSTQHSADKLGNFGKFVPPVVANGRVYVGTWSSKVVVYGLLSTFTAAPGSLTFGSVLAGSQSASQTVTVTNTGTSTLHVSGITLSGSGAAAFPQTNNCSGGIAVGASCTISVSFAPSASGPASATLAIASSGGAPTQNVALAGTGVVPSGSIAPASIAFGNQVINTASASQALTVTNTGTVPLPFTGVTLSGSNAPNFSQTNNCGNSVAVGASCTINVSFKPVTVGTAAATLAISAAGASPVSLSGSGSFQIQLTASAASVTEGVADTLSWSSTPNAVCTASGGASGDHWAGALAANGSQAVTENAIGTATFTVSCTLNGVSSSASIRVAFTVPSATLSATPATLERGGSVTLSWTSKNATACTASGGQSGDSWAQSRPTQGSATVTPTGAGTVVYQLTCTSGPQSAVATATVTVDDPPSSGGGGGALDAEVLLSLLALLWLRRPIGAPYGSRTRVPALRGPCPRPLDEGSVRPEGH